ncbi:hypothetical protein PPERSA_10656 [Pseudocohnilembus persalinus]|uniref:Snf7 family n=1 Tax=Pseudocohnilembus persalinus TaxID=266149 RepID=A0A0V0QD82_PSEPJ|nr:hypothetical protein PPERSA_10656 [Pseudocohnilembus persalinus]|eukprot:KRX00157.1 hypothetical protein PPERSA_10656 [Pseudocohnilembus persalinus]
MGANNDKPQQPVKQPDPLDVILDMKMTAKRFERDSAKAEKEKAVQTKKAKMALQKGNEEGARLYLQNAAMKQQESLNLLRMAHKLEAIQSNLKSNLSNQEMASQLNRITPYLQQHAQSVPIEQLYGQMQNFEQAMDEVTVQNKIVTNIVNQNSDVSQDIVVDQMLQQMKNEQMAEISNQMDLNNQAQYQQLQNNNQQMQQNQPQQNQNQQFQQQ